MTTDIETVAPSRGRGRPTKFTPELSKKIVLSVRRGAYMETAAAFAGISKDTLYVWLRKGANETSGPFFEFSDAMKRALAESEINDIATIGKASRTQWQAAAWRLERKFPDRWGRRERVTITGKDDGPVQLEQAVDPTKLSDEALAQLIAILSGANRAADESEGRSRPTSPPH